MELYLSDKKGVPIQKDMIGLFFEDINYAADGGLYAEMIENRSFEFLDCYGTVGDYYTKHDPGYAWEPTQEYGQGRMEYVMGSPLDRANPHYLRFTADYAGQGFANKAYDGLRLEKAIGPRFMRAASGIRAACASRLSRSVWNTWQRRSPA